MTRLKIKFVSWFNDRYRGKYCWADCVAWAYSKRLNPFKIDSSKGCEIESKEHSTNLCYCGGWKDGKCFALLPKEEQEKIRKELREEPIIGFPF